MPQPFDTACLLPSVGWMRVSLVPLALLVDSIVGDPRWLPHPVVIMGRSISALEGWLNRAHASPGARKAMGALTVALVVPGSFMAVWALLYLASLWGAWPHFVISVWLMSTCFAMRGLADAGLEIAALLTAGDLPEARRKVGWIVGRDTDRMDGGQVCRAAVETVAENASDGVIAPILYGLIGGPALAMAYKAVNTLDSMVGHKSERFLYFGWAGARFDDLWNLLPARLTAVFLLVAAYLTGRDARGGRRAVSRDAHRHPSPNSGYPEAAVAGALGVQLGGLNHYRGVPQERARMGDPLKALDAGALKASVTLMVMASVLFAAAGAAVVVVSEVLKG